VKKQNCGQQHNLAKVNKRINIALLIYSGLKTKPERFYLDNNVRLGFSQGVPEVLRLRRTLQKQHQ
jgi:hypothetical protein